MLENVLMKELLRVSILNGKYTVVQRFNGSLEVLRHNMYWRDETGDNLILGLAQEVETLRELLHEIQFNLMLDPRDKRIHEVDAKITELLKEHEREKITV